MSGHRMVLFIDGPLRGKLKYVDQPPMFFPEQPIEPFISASALFTTGNINPETYHFHHIAIFGHALWLGSVSSSDPLTTNMDDLWELLLSSAARQAEG